MANHPECEVLAIFLQVIRAYQVESQEVNHHRLRDPVEQVLREKSEPVARIVDADFVKLGVAHKELLAERCLGVLPRELVILEVEEGEVHYRDGGESDVVHLVDEWLVEHLGAEDGPEAKDILGANVQDILVESVEDQEGVATVGFAAVDEHQGLQEPELRDREVHRPRCLRAFLAEYTDANVRLLDHIDIIGPVADRQRYLCLVVVLDQVDDVRLLFWRHAARQNYITLIRKLDKTLLELLALVKSRQCRATHDQRLLLGPGVLLDFGERVTDFASDGVFFALGDLMLIHIGVEQAGGVADVDGGANLVTGKHPDLDAGSFDKLDNFRDFRLQSILNGR